MNHELSKQELLSRYLHEVRRNLGRKAPQDLPRELESLIGESMEAREAAIGRALTSAETADLLREFGSPESVARRYSPQPEYLIGPEFYPVFLTVAKVLVGVAAGLPFLLLIVSRMAHPGDPPSLSQALFGWLGMSYQIALGGLAWCVLVFALLERLGITRPGAPEVEWNPFDLPPVEDASRASRIGAGVRIYLAVVLAVLFNFYPDWVGIYILSSGHEPYVVNLKALGIQLPLMALNFWWALSIVQNFRLMKTGRWSPAIRVLELGLGLFGAAILYQVIRTTSEATIRDAFTAALPAFPVADLIARLLPQVLWVALLMVLANGALRAYRLVRQMLSDDVK